MRRSAVCALIALASPALAGAQRLGESCPMVNGLSISMSATDTGASRSDSARDRLRVDSRSVIDTTWRFNIPERRWTRSQFTASIGAGWSGNARSRGTTTAPDSAASRDWSVCAAVAIGMREPTLVLRGARGVVHLRADVRALARMRRGSDTTSVPRR
jgi:hypothetical protein